MAECVSGQYAYKKLAGELKELLRSRRGHEDATPTREQIEEAVESLDDVPWMIVTLNYGLNGDPPLCVSELVEQMARAYPTMHWSNANIYSMLNEAVLNMVNHLVKTDGQTLHDETLPTEAITGRVLRHSRLRLDFWRSI